MNMMMTRKIRIKRWRFLAINYADKEGESIRVEVPLRWREVDYSLHIVSC